MNEIESPINSEVQRLLRLFSTLPDVKFPDVDATVLHELGERVKQRHQAVLEAETQLESARRALEEEHERLLKKAHRLHSWLTVMAETDEPLSAQLLGISLPRQKKTRVEGASATGEEPVAPKKRRSRRTSAANEALFEEATHS